MITVNAAILYFGAYVVIAIFWKALRPYFRNALFVGMALWLINILIVFPLLGRGLLGYKLPQGWMSASLPLLLTHWIFARGLQYQEKQ